eukprot:18505-Heterococcus_DN1.PRE.1
MACTHKGLHKRTMPRMMRDSTLSDTAAHCSVNSVCVHIVCLWPACNVSTHCKIYSSECSTVIHRADYIRCVQQLQALVSADCCITTVYLPPQRSLALHTHTYCMNVSLCTINQSAQCSLIPYTAVYTHTA